MQLVEQHIIKKSNHLYKELDKMCLLSKNLYNQSLYRVRQYYFENKKYMSLRFLLISDSLHPIYPLYNSSLPSEKRSWFVEVVHQISDFI